MKPNFELCAARLVVVLFACFAPAVASSQSTQVFEINRYREFTSIKLEVCTVEADMVLTLLQLVKLRPTERERLHTAMDGVDQCILKSVQETRELLKQARAAVSSSSSATALLLDHYVAWQGALDSVKPDFEESPLRYRTRLRAALQKAEDAWRRLAVEVGS